MRVLGHQPGVGIVTAAVIFNFVKGFESISDVLNLNDSCPARGREGFNGFSRLIKNAVNENLPAEMIRKISKSDYREYLEHTYPDFMERLEDIEQFALFAEQYGALTDFLAEVTLNDDYGVGMRDGARDKIILSTIHQAKGLEWETVFVMRLQEGSFPHKKSLEELTALEEERRLFYVAVTRAKRRLFLTYPICAGMTGFEFGEPSSFIQEVPRSLFDEAHCGQPSANRDYLDGVFDDDEPVIVLNHIGETKKQNRKSPTSFLRDV
jgi:DNA helicase-2/ATP-dependent DNA helicase PcrA